MFPAVKARNISESTQGERTRYEILIADLLRDHAVGSSSRGVYEATPKEFELFGQSLGFEPEVLSARIDHTSMVPIVICHMWVVKLLREKNLLPGTISSKISHIKKSFNKFGKPHPLDTVQWAAFMGAVHLSTPHKPDKAQPIDATMIASLREVCIKRGLGYKRSASVWHRLAVIVILAYAGFLRINEALDLSKDRVEFFDTHMVLSFEGEHARKNDRYRQGGRVFIAATNGPLCPVSSLREWIRVMGASNPRALLFPGQGHKGRVQSISYETIRIQLRSVFEEMGLDTTVFRTHSMRTGGATAASAAGVPNELSAKHGGWADLFAYHGYVQLCLRDRLLPSQSLGL